MQTTRKWSLLVPLAGLALAVVLLPVATARWVPFALQDTLGYLVVWVPLVAAAVVAAVLAGRQTGTRWWRALSWRSSGIGMLVGVFVALLVRSAAFVIELLVTGRISGGAVGLGGTSAGVAELVWVLVASALVAPVIEETFFRGVLQPALIERSGSGRAAPGIGILASALLFALVHALAGASLLGAVITFIAGAGFGVVARSSGLLAAIVAHVVFNASGLALVLANAPMFAVRPTLGLG
ncbi:CPBP family intramembrane glutamic endopeptidase [Labedella populi]|nr:type II CAAX endopeptidase family protein [Labedella populi]